jgi:hypothetical protein
MTPDPSLFWSTSTDPLTAVEIAFALSSIVTPPLITNRASNANGLHLAASPNFVYVQADTHSTVYYPDTHVLIVAHCGACMDAVAVPMRPNQTHVGLKCALLAIFPWIQSENELEARLQAQLVTTRLLYL